MDIEFREFVGEWDWGWINQICPVMRVEDTGGIMAIDVSTDTTVGAFITDNWTQNSVQCHFMIDNPMVLKHSFLECCFNYVFNVRGMSRIYGMVPANNEKAIKINTHMGFTVKARLEDAFEVGVDYLIMELKRENCMYLDQAKAA